MKDIFQTVYSPCCGTVEKIFVEPMSYVYEWEKLVLIKTNEEKEIEVSIGVSGNITALEISQGQYVTPDTALAVLKDDLEITGSD
ncbi:hypothetical protein QGM71_06745 [Virgibacillus sp. C22-A2]|uniref:Lipoyl-binding domain-containing protein n=1 Tax=Virgibacillus tibetensis TaxID=3042313 RepID=A0ABU6KDQ1_9BACI|nr:hypothetical protein [Virgibacillus sp. C22-A2]